MQNRIRSVKKREKVLTTRECQWWQSAGIKQFMFLKMSSESEVIITQSPAGFICPSEMRTSQSVEHFNRIAPDKLVSYNFTWQAGACFQYYFFSELHEKLYTRVHCGKINYRQCKNKIKWFFSPFLYPGYFPVQTTGFHDKAIK